jgi:CHAD domain-containing protein
MTFHLLKHETIPDGLRRIAKEQIGAAIDYIDDDAMPMNTKVHSLRKSCKKMRGLLRLAKPLSGEALEIEDQRFRAAAKCLAAYRDTDVYTKTIESLVGRDAATKSLPSEISEGAIQESRNILTACLEDVENWPLELYGFVDIGPGFARTYRKCTNAWEEALRDPEDDKYHRLRKWSKYHWYQIRILERLNKSELRKRRKHVRKLQLDLGDAHDLFMLQSILASDADPDMQLLERAISRKHELYANALKLGHRVFATSVDELVADCATWWVQWKH